MPLSNDPTENVPFTPLEGFYPKHMGAPAIMGSVSAALDDAGLVDELREALSERQFWAARAKQAAAAAAAGAKGTISCGYSDSDHLDDISAKLQVSNRASDCASARMRKRARK